MKFARQVGHAITLIPLLGAVAVAIAPAAVGQAGPSRGSSVPPWNRQLTAKDATRVENVEKQIEQLRREGRFADAIGPARDVAEIRTRLQGAAHWQAADARRAVDDLGKIAALPEKGRQAMATVGELDSKATDALERAQYSEAERLGRSSLEINRRWLGEGHPAVAGTLSNVAVSLYYQGKSVESEPLFRKSLAIRLQVLGEEHPHTAELTSTSRPTCVSKGSRLKPSPSFARPWPSRSGHGGRITPTPPTATTASRSTWMTRGNPPRPSPSFARPWPSGSGRWAPATTTQRSATPASGTT
jgi:hypothetical protein